MPPKMDINGSDMRIWCLQYLTESFYDTYAVVMNAGPWIWLTIMPIPFPKLEKICAYPENIVGSRGTCTSHSSLGGGSVPFTCFGNYFSCICSIAQCLILSQLPWSLIKGHIDEEKLLESSFSPSVKGNIATALSSRIQRSAGDLIQWMPQPWAIKFKHLTPKWLNGCWTKNRGKPPKMDGLFFGKPY